MSDSIAWVLGHPVRCRILVILDVRVASSTEISREMKIPLGEIAYHCREMSRVGIIEIVDEQPVRGSTEKFYKAVRHPEVSAEEYERLPTAARMDIDKQVIHHAAADMGTALNAGTFTATSDHYNARTPLEVDEIGWADMGEAFAALHDRIREIQGESANRRAAGASTDLRPVSSFISFFRMPNPARNDTIVPWGETDSTG